MNSLKIVNFFLLNSQLLIGFQSLVTSLKRRENSLYVCNPRRR